MDNKEAEAALTEKRQRMARAYIAEDIYREQLARESANRPTNDYDPRSTLGKFEREVTEKKQPRPADKAKLGHELADNRTSERKLRQPNKDNLFQEPPDDLPID